MKSTTLILLSLLIASCQKETIKTQKQVDAIMLVRNTAISNSIPSNIKSDTTIKGTEYVTYTNTPITLAKTPDLRILGRYYLTFSNAGKSFQAIGYQTVSNGISSIAVYSWDEKLLYWSFKVNSSGYMDGLTYVNEPPFESIGLDGRNFLACMTNAYKQCSTHWSCYLLCGLGNYMICSGGWFGMCVAGKG